MTYATVSQTALDYFPCRYGTSKLLFRGPRRRLQDDYVVFLGGTETFGKFIEMPFSTLTEHETGMKSVNLGCVNAGIDAYITDKSLMGICAKAKVTVIQVMGAQNMSNRFYAVHSRRNDRFLRASTLLNTIYQEVDFTEFNFTGHLLTTLEAKSPEKFRMVRQELQDAWVARMQMMIAQIEGPVILLWLADHEVEAGLGQTHAEPMFIEQGMIDAIRPKLADVVSVSATRDEVTAGIDEMIFAEMERPAATEMLGPVVHRRIAAELAKVLPRRR
jgi:hypothetical protein